MRRPSTIRALLRRMIVESEAEQPVADAIARHEGWIMAPEERRRRILQTLRGDANRHFCADWLPIAVRICVARGADEVVTGVLDQARRDGMRDRELAEDRADMARIASRAAQRRHA